METQKISSSVAKNIQHQETRKVCILSPCLHCLTYHFASPTVLTLNLSLAYHFTSPTVLTLNLSLSYNFASPTVLTLNLSLAYNLASPTVLTLNLSLAYNFTKWSGSNFRLLQYLYFLSTCCVRDVTSGCVLTSWQSPAVLCSGGRSTIDTAARWGGCRSTEPAVAFSTSSTRPSLISSSVTPTATITRRSTEKPTAWSFSSTTAKGLSHFSAGYARLS